MQQARRLSKNIPVNSHNQGILRDGYNACEGRFQYGLHKKSGGRGNYYVVVHLE